MVDYTQDNIQDEPMSAEDMEKEQEKSKLSSYIYRKFYDCETARRSDEDRWLEAYHNYRGRYYKNVKFRDHEKSRVFVKVTKTKVLAAYGQITDVLFSANKFPISVEETKIPEGELESAHLDDVKYQYGQGNVKDIVVDAVGTKFGDYIDGYGTTSVIKTSWSANADIDFGLSDPDLKLSGKITNMGITDPDFTATITTLNRKLGINHTPGHSHPGQFSSAQASFIGPQVWSPTSLTISGSTDHPNCSQIKSIQHTCDLNPSVGQAPDWANGRTLTAYYGSDQYEYTLPVADKFHNFVNLK